MRENFFSLDVRKILNTRKLRAGLSREWPQNIVKEQLTRKLFWNQDLVQFPIVDFPLSTSDPMLVR